MLHILEAMCSLFSSDLNKSEATAFCLGQSHAAFLGLLAINPLSLEVNNQSSPPLTQTSDMIMINCLDMTAPSSGVMNYVVQGTTKDSPLSVDNIECWQFS